MSIAKKSLAELIGTFWLTFGGCGSAVLAAKFFADEGENTFNLGIGLVGVSFAFGLTLLTMAYAIGHISGCHINPAVSVGLFVGGRFSGAELVPYILSQVVGGALGAGALYLIASGGPDFVADGNFLAANGYGDMSPGGYSLGACFFAEVLLTFMFLLIILGSTDSRVPAGFGPIPIGFSLVLIHLISIPVTNTSVNPARSLGPAIFVGGAALSQVWMFWVAPIIGAALAGIVYRWMGSIDS
ncbi:MAG: aquaporin Z [Cyanobacteria bacterium P01_A01_bin.3]